MAAKHHVVSSDTHRLMNITYALLISLLGTSFSIASTTARPVTLPLEDAETSSGLILPNVLESCSADDRLFFFQPSTKAAYGTVLNDFGDVDDIIDPQHPSPAVKTSNLAGLITKYTPCWPSPGGEVYNLLHKRRGTPQDQKNFFIFIGCGIAIVVVLAIVMTYFCYNWRNRNASKPTRSFFYHSLYCCACCYCNCLRPEKRRRKRERREAAELALNRMAAQGVVLTGGATGSRPAAESNQTASDAGRPPPEAAGGEAVPDDRPADSSPAGHGSSLPPTYQNLEAAPPGYSRV